MKVKLDAYMRGFKPNSSDSPKLTDTTQTVKVSKTWSHIPVRCFIDANTAADKGVLLVGFSPRLRYVTKELAHEILKKYDGFKRIKFLPRRFIPAYETLTMQVPIDLLIG